MQWRNQHGIPGGTEGGGHHRLGFPVGAGALLLLGTEDTGAAGPIAAGLEFPEELPTALRTALLRQLHQTACRGLAIAVAVAGRPIAGATAAGLESMG